jgi:hypothetical protein
MLLGKEYFEILIFGFLAVHDHQYFFSAKEARSEMTFK